MSSKRIRTRLLFLSDTHGASLLPTSSAVRHHHHHHSTHVAASSLSSSLPPLGNPFREPLPPADLVLHSGDLTYTSSVSEFEATFALLRSLPAPLKLVIPGNHDLALDDEFFGRAIARRPDRDELATWPARVRDVIRTAEADGVHVLLEEGMHEFVLGNGATRGGSGGSSGAYSSDPAGDYGSDSASQPTFSYQGNSESSGSTL